MPASFGDVTVREIWVVGNQGNDPEKVLTLPDGEWLNAVHWSPDGKRLGYVHVRQVSERFTSSVETSRINGRSRTVIVQDPELWITDFCWLPDDRMIYATQESAGADDGNLWTVNVNTPAGVATAKPKQITQWAGAQIDGISVETDGKRLFLQKRHSHGQIFLGQLSPSGTHMSPPRRLTVDDADDWPTAWTLDSKAVLSSSYRNSRWQISKQELGRDAAESLTPESGNAFLPRLSPDGAWVLYGSWASGTMMTSGVLPPMHMMRVPVNGGLPQFVFDMPKATNWQCSQAPSNLCVVLERSEDAKRFWLTAFDPLKGRGKPLRSIERVRPFVRYAHSLSPDGSTFAIAESGERVTHIHMLSLSGGTDREIRVQGCPDITGLDWSADGKSLYCGSMSSEGGTLSRVELNGSSQMLWQYRGAGGFGYAVFGIPSPNGRYLAIRGGALTSNAWMIEGF